MRKRVGKIGRAGVICLSCLMFSGCGGPSEEKIAQAQEAYAQLAEIHNEVVEAHKEIQDASLDKGLQALAEKVDKVDDFALNEMKDEDIDFLIDTMNTIKQSYEEYLVKIDEIKASEEAAVLIPISLTLVNSTEQTFSQIILHPQNSTSQKIDVLQGAFSFEPKQSLTGLVVNKDVNATPWILELENLEGTSYTIELSVKDFDENGEVLELIVDTETGELLFQE